MGRTDRVLSGLGRGADLLLRPVQHVLGLLADRADHVGRAPAYADRSALGLFAELLAPVPDGEPSDERSQDESKHRRPPFLLRRSLRRLDERPRALRRARGVPRPGAGRTAVEIMCAAVDNSPSVRFYSV